MRIAMFGIASPISHACLMALAREGHDLLFVMEDVPFRRKVKQTILRRWPASEDFARTAGIPRTRYRQGTCREDIARFRPDILCIAAFTQLIPQSLAQIAPLGAINFHPSMLPRHRGPRPIFWAYYHGDSRLGLTVHRASEKFDAGAIIVQESIPIPRGYPGEKLLGDVLAHLGPVVNQAIALVQAGAPERAQGDENATRAPRVDPARFRAPIEEWDGEQSWHFLRGVFPGFRQPLRDPRGRPVHYHSVGEFARMENGWPAGTVEPQNSGWLLHVNGGTIELER